MASDDFLEAERVASELVDSLSRLKGEIESYSSAGKALDEVRVELGALVDSTRELASRTHEATAALCSIGGPKIIDQLQRVRGLLEESAVSQDVAAKETRKEMEEISSKIRTTQILVCLGLAGVAAVLLFVLI